MQVIHLTPVEAFLGVAIATMMGCALISILLSGWITLRTHIAFTMLVVFIGGFSEIVLFGPTIQETPVIGGLALACLIALFKLMGQFEIVRKPIRRRDGNTLQK